MRAPSSLCLGLRVQGFGFRGFGLEASSLLNKDEQLFLPHLEKAPPVYLSEHFGLLS